MIVEMILEALRVIIMGVLDTFMSAIHIPSIPEDVMQHMYEYLDLFVYARGFIGFFIPGAAFEFGASAFFILFTVEKIYPVIMWVIKKIPLSVD